MRGRLITVEGIDGAGKSTLVAGIVRERPDYVLLREPGGVGLSEAIRELVQNGEHPVGARAEALLYAAARAQLVEERLRPLLEDGRSVLLDRFLDSSLAYQGGGRGLGIDEIRQINLFGTGGLKPDRTLLLRIPVEAARARQGEKRDRLEREADDFFAAVAAAYDALAAAEPKRFTVLDATMPPRLLLPRALAVVP